MNPRTIVATCLSAALTSLAYAGAAASKPAEPPHIVLIVIDTLRADHLGCYGYARATSPNIDALAAEGARFDECLSAASWTTPSLMSLFTGLMPSAHGCVDFKTALSKAIPTLPEQLAGRGYDCLGVVSNPCIGRPYGFARGFRTFDDFTIAGGMEPKVDGADSASTAPQVTRLAMGLLQDRKDKKPVFLFVHYMDPHDDYTPPAPFARKFDPDYAGDVDGRKVGRWRTKLPAERDLKRLVSLYDGEIAFTDQHVGKLLKEVAAALPPERTLVILIGDHGEAFGEHGSLLHGNSVYREETRVPMIWRWPGTIPPGRKVASPVSLLDVPATLAGRLGLADMDVLQGRSLWPGLAGGELPADRLIVVEKANGDERHVVAQQGTLRLHRLWTAGKEAAARCELYDLSADAGESKDLYKSGGVRKLEQSLDDALRATKVIGDAYRSRGSSGAVGMTEADRRRLQELGYINK